MKANRPRGTWLPGGGFLRGPQSDRKGGRGGRTEEVQACLILISNKMLYLKSRVFHTLVPHVPCVTPSHKNLTRLAL